MISKLDEAMTFVSSNTTSYNNQFIELGEAVQKNLNISWKFSLELYQKAIQLQPNASTIDLYYLMVKLHQQRAFL